MKAEKIIKPANGYVMLLVTLILFIGSIAFSIQQGNPIYLIITAISFIGFFGFILVNPNTSQVILLFGKYVGTIKDNGLYWANPFFTKNSIPYSYGDLPKLSRRKGILCLIRSKIICQN